MSNQGSDPRALVFWMNRPSQAEIILAAYRRILFGRVSSLLLLLWAVLTGATVATLLADPDRAYAKVLTAGGLVFLVFIGSAKALAVIVSKYLFEKPKRYELSVDARGLHHPGGYSLLWEAVREVHDTPRWLFLRLKGGRIPRFGLLHKRYIEPASVVSDISETVRKGAAHRDIPHYTHRYG